MKLFVFHLQIPFRDNSIELLQNGIQVDELSRAGGGGCHGEPGTQKECPRATTEREVRKENAGLQTAVDTASQPAARTTTPGLHEEDLPT